MPVRRRFCRRTEMVGGSGRTTVAAHELATLGGGARRSARSERWLVFLDEFSPWTGENEIREPRCGCPATYLAVQHPEDYELATVTAYKQPTTTRRASASHLPSWTTRTVVPPPSGRRGWSSSSCPRSAGSAVFERAVHRLVSSGSRGSRSPRGTGSRRRRGSWAELVMPMADWAVRHEDLLESNRRARSERRRRKKGGKGRPPPKPG